VWPSDQPSKLSESRAVCWRAGRRRSRHIVRAARRLAGLPVVGLAASARLRIAGLTHSAALQAHDPAGAAAWAAIPGSTPPC
jgi:hypothetical protein